MSCPDCATWRAHAEALAGALREAQEWADRIAGDERVCGWVHQEDYGLYCLLADCPVDFDAVLARPPAQALAESSDVVARKTLWLSHGCVALYGDDGEMQCGACLVDFTRDSWQTIGHRLARRIAAADQADAERRTLEICATELRALRRLWPWPLPADAPLEREHRRVLKDTDLREVDAVLAALDRARCPPKTGHGVDCFKEPHWVVGTAYLHGAEDDTPYDVDGVAYCGRCHHVLDAARREGGA